MDSKSIPEVAVERSVSWIAAVENALVENCNEKTTKEIMKIAGTKCAEQILRECEKVLGKSPENVDELIEGTNARRKKQIGINSLWERSGNIAHLKITECGCTLVKAGLCQPNPVHCLCTVGMFETIFTSVCTGPVEVEVIQTIGTGDEACEFNIHFQE